MSNQSFGTATHVPTRSSVVGEKEESPLAAALNPLYGLYYDLGKLNNYCLIL